MFLDANISRTSTDGHFYIDLRRHLDVYLKYAPWTDGIRIYRHDAGKWVLEPKDPDIPLINSAHNALPALPIHCFLSTVPEPVRQCLAPFSYLQTTMLRICSFSPNARDLARNIPLLLWLAADAVEKEKWPEASRGVSPEAAIDELLGRKRKQILQLLFGTGNACTVRFLKKIRLLGGERDELKLIDRAIRTGLPETFRHWTTVPIHLLAILERFPEMAGSKLLLSFAGRQYDSLQNSVSKAYSTGRLWEDVYYMGRVLEIGDAAKTLNTCASVDALQRVHDRWTAALNRKKTIASSGAVFPTPPIAGNRDIHPIRTVDDLLAEGRLMHHCVGGYVEKVLSGASYIYRVTSPERATLELTGFGKQMQIAQLRLAHNQMPSKNTYQTVRNWLNARLAVN